MAKPRHPPVFKSVIDDNPEEYYRWNLQLAQKSKATSARVLAARELLDGFVVAVQTNKPIPRPIVEHLVVGLKKYLDEGVRLESALHLNPPRNRPRGGHTVDPDRAVAMLYLFMKRDGYNKTQAIEATCERLPVTKRNLERFDAEYNVLQNFDLAELEQYAQPVVSAPRTAKKSR